MQTYYQKHHSIKATQFDGTLQQLRYTLPNYIFNQLIMDLIEPKNNSQLLYNQHRQVTLIMNNKFMPWSKTSVKCHQTWQSMNKNSLNLWEPGLYNDDQHWYHKVWRRKITKKNLHPGQYISLHQQYRVVSMYKILGTSDHYVSKLDLVKIHGRADFEAHWSKTPVKERMSHVKS